MPTGERPARGTWRAGGFSYVGLLILLAILGLVAATGLKMGAVVQRTAAEQALLDIGGAFSDALKSYAEASVSGQPDLPASLQDLLKDTRFPVPRRHLRRIFIDPITGSSQWGLTYLQDKDGVTGVYSLSTARPIKRARFAARFSSFEARPARAYRDWIFTAEQAAPPPVPAPQASTRLPPARTLSNPLDLIDVPHIAPGASRLPAPPATTPPPDPGGRTLSSPLGP